MISFKLYLTKILICLGLFSASLPTAYGVNSSKEIGIENGVCDDGQKYKYELFFKKNEAINSVLNLELINTGNEILNFFGDFFNILTFNHHIVEIETNKRINPDISVFTHNFGDLILHPKKSKKIQFLFSHHYTNLKEGRIYKFSWNMKVFLFKKTTQESITCLHRGEILFQNIK